jgi:RecA-family ATPase
MEKVSWVWPGWLARGKLHLLGGQKGTGKSTIAFDLLAQMTVGGKWPDGTTAPIGDVLIWSGEDDIKDTILPRFVVAGGDRSRVWFVDGIVSDGVKRAFDPAADTW